MGEPQWKERIWKDLRERSQRQNTQFQTLIASHTKLLQKEKELSDRNLLLEKEVRQLKRELSTRGGGSGVGGGNGSGVMGTSGLHDSMSFGGGDYESKIMKLQEDLSASYKANSDKTEAILKYTTDLRAANEKLKAALEEIESKKKQLADAEFNCASLEDSLKEKEDTLKYLQEELRELQAALLKSEETASVHRVENNQLLERWMAKMNEEAERMNEANEFFTALMNACKRVQIEQKADELTASVKNKPLQSSILDFGRSGLALVPSTIKRNFQGHKEEINDIKCSPGGSMFATGSNDKIVKLWDSRSGALRSMITGSVQSVMYVAFSSNEELILGTGNDNTTRVWGVEQCRIRHTLTGHTAKVYAAEFTSDSKRVVSGSHDRTLKLWDLSRGYCTRTIFCFSSCNDLALNTTGSVITSAHFDGSARMWDSRQGDSIRTLNVHQKPITSCCNTNDGRFLLTMSRDNTLKLTDLRTFETYLTFKDPEFRFSLNWARACVSHDSQYVAAPSQDGSIFVWNTTDAKLEKVLTGAHENSHVVCVSWNPLGHQLMSADRNGNIAIWE